jgi:hypothetical protein
MAPASAKLWLTARSCRTLHGHERSMHAKYTYIDRRSRYRSCIHVWVYFTRCDAYHGALAMASISTGTSAGFLATWIQLRAGLGLGMMRSNTALTLGKSSMSLRNTTRSAGLVAADLYCLGHVPVILTTSFRLPPACLITSSRLRIHCLLLISDQVGDRCSVLSTYSVICSISP